MHARHDVDGVCDCMCFIPSGFSVRHRPGAKLMEGCELLQYYHNLYKFVSHQGLLASYYMAWYWNSMACWLLSVVYRPRPAMAMANWYCYCRTSGPLHSAILMLTLRWNTNLLLPTFLLMHINKFPLFFILLWHYLSQFDVTYQWSISILASGALNLHGYIHSRHI